MSEHVSRETHSTTLIDLQVAQRRAGRRKNVRHGGTLCHRCLTRPPRANADDCLECHRQSQKDYRLRVKQRAVENQNTSKGIDYGQYEGSGRSGKTA